MRKYFGTDGVRGTANKGVMTAENALRLGLAAGTFFKRGNHLHKVIIGKDTRLSGYLFETAITSGLLAAGMDVFLVGPMPTPAVAMLVKSMRADLGVMITASHNPYHDNGFKLFGPDGHKLSDETERKIEAIMDNPKDIILAEPEQLGKAARINDAPGRYVEFIKNSFPKGKTLEGFKIVIDCANGASYHLGAKIFWELGAKVIEIGVSPNGLNINLDCGSNHLEKLSAAVIEHKADLGIALDGDADRLQMVDENGNPIDGDKILALIACYMQKHNLLKSNKIVATIMSNKAFENYLNSKNIEVIRTQVGDRYIAAKMQELDINLGGEQSGHIVVGDYSTTGDGLVTALQMLAVLEEKQKPISSILNIYEPFPQVLKNIPIKDPNILQSHKYELALKDAEQILNGKARVIVRKSGTENLIRVMCECEDTKLLHKVLEKIEEALK